MRKNIEELIDKTYEWYSIYERLAWTKKDIKINITCEKENIDICITDNFAVIDDLTITFNDKEQDLYNYVVIKLYKLIFNNIYIHREGNVYYNAKHRPYLDFMIKDEYLKSLASIMNDEQKDGPNLDKEFVTKELYHKIHRKKCDKELLTGLDTHIWYSKKLIKGRNLWLS